MSRGRKVIIGLDGVPFGLLQDLSRNGIMPNTQTLLSKGIFKKMRSSIPEISSVAWSSIITGANPAEHGIFGFTDLVPGTYNLCFPNFSDLKRSPFWEDIQGKSIIINVPATYPIREMNGIHISGFVSLDLERSVHPTSLVPELRRLDYRLDVDSTIAHRSLELFLEDLDKTLAARIETYRYLWSRLDWQIFMLVFTGTDRLMHFLWDAYEDESHQYHNAFLDHFRKIDQAIGEINSRILDDDLLIIISDHGFEHLEKEVYLNFLLSQEGFLRLDGISDNPWSHINYPTKAFALDPARIYLNLKNKYPKGSVGPKDQEKILRDLEQLFGSLEIDNQRVIRNVYHKEEIYSGPRLDNAPDLVLVPNPGFNLKASLKEDRLSGRDVFTGKHTLDDAFLLTNKRVNGGMISDSLSVTDVVEIVTEGLHSKGEEEIIKRRLKDLGYL